MPVRPLHVLAGVLAVLLLPTLAAAKDNEPRVPKTAVIKRAEQLEKDKRVRRQRTPYQLASSAVLIHNECAKELGLTAPQKQFVDAQFQLASRNYLEALEQAFIDRMKAASTDELKQDYVRYLRDQQKPAVNNTAGVIKKLGCKDKSITEVVNYFTALQASEEEEKNKTAISASNPVPPAPDVLHEAPPTVAAPISEPAPAQTKNP